MDVYTKGIANRWLFCERR